MKNKDILDFLGCSKQTLTLLEEDYKGEILEFYQLFYQLRQIKQQAVRHKNISKSNQKKKKKVDKK